jgi:hypothetical protein
MQNAADPAARGPGGMQKCKIKHIFGAMQHHRDPVTKRLAIRLTERPAHLMRVKGAPALSPSLVPRAEDRQSHSM